MLHLNGVGGIPAEDVAAVVMNVLAPIHGGSGSGSAVVYPSNSTVAYPATTSSLSWSSSANRATLVQPAVSQDLNGQTSCYNVANTCGYVTIQNYGPGDLYFVVDVQGWFVGKQPQAKCASFNSQTGVCNSGGSAWG